MKKKAKKKGITIRLISAKQFEKIVLNPIADLCKRAGVDITLGGL